MSAFCVAAISGGYFTTLKIRILINTVVGQSPDDFGCSGGRINLKMMKF